MQLPPLTTGILVKRYKRFLADVDFGGTVEVVHCPNPGAMTGLKAAGSRVWCSTSDNPARKLKKTLELIAVDGVLANSVLVGINTNLPNKLVLEALTAKTIPAFAEFDVITPEFTYAKGTRFDFKLGNKGGNNTMILEVKNVHLARANAAAFPDSVTARGTKHLNALAAIAASGQRAAMLYIIQRSDGDYFTLADDIDPAYAEAYIKAVNAGVEMHAWQCAITTSMITIEKPIPIRFKKL